ncbi:MAG: hypothetical protein WBZ29_07460 [Methanocella sp.]
MCHNYTILDEVIAIAIVLILVCGVAYAISGSSGSHDDPYTVSLSYTKTLDNGTTMKYYETNASLYKMYIHNSPVACNVTCDRLVGFILNDSTDQVPYGDGSYICIDYAVAVHDNAERQNITAGLVTCEVNGSMHALNVFNTTDRGLVYVDCTGAMAGEPVHNYDKIARIDGRYQVEPMIDISPYYYVNDKNDTVSNVHVYW